MKLAALYSGGKDSTMAMYWAIKNGHGVQCLVTLLPQRNDSYMFQVPNVEFTRFHSEALGIPLLAAKTPGVKEAELKELKEILELAKERYLIEGVTAGALASKYQKERVEQICRELKLACFAPYWHCDPETYLQEIIGAGFTVVITAVAAEGLGQSLLGKTLTLELVRELKRISEKTAFHLCFEGGEAETMVLDGPIFKKRLEIVDSEIVMEGSSGYLKIKQMRLADKQDSGA